MPGDISAQAKAALNSANAAIEIATLVTIEDDSLAAPLRYTDAAKRLGTDPLQYGIVSNGQTYKYALKNAMLPDEAENNAQATTIAIDNVVEDVAPSIRGLSIDVEVSVGLVLASYPDTQFASIADLKIVGRTYDLETVVIEVSRHGPGGNDFLEPLSGERQTRNKSPGLHR